VAIRSPSNGAPLTPAPTPPKPLPLLPSKSAAAQRDDPIEIISGACRELKHGAQSGKAHKYASRYRSSLTHTIIRLGTHKAPKKSTSGRDDVLFPACIVGDQPFTPFTSCTDKLALPIAPSGRAETCLQPPTLPSRPMRPRSMSRPSSPAYLADAETKQTHRAHGVSTCPPGIALSTSFDDSPLQSLSVQTLTPRGSPKPVYATRRYI
jgi:hypothetical protein